MRWMPGKLSVPGEAQWRLFFSFVRLGFRLGRKMRAGIGGLNLLVPQGAALNEGIHDVMGAMAAQPRRLIAFENPGPVVQFALVK